jgi:hypothetical protein
LVKEAPAPKEILMRRIADLEAEVADLKEQIASKDAALMATQQSGWEVSTPNPKYTGVTAGVEFKNGFAFVPDATKNAEAVVKRLASDFHYTAVRKDVAAALA